MQSFVKIGDREVAVDIEPDGDAAVRVEVEGRSYRVDVCSEGSSVGAMSLVVDGRQFEVLARATGSQQGAKTYQLHLDGRQLAASVADPLAHLAQEAAGGAGAARVDAYMPGRVVALLVEEGEEVEAGQGILVLEAMKMENEIAAEAAGVVSEFFVEVGQAVEGGDALFEVKPPEE